MTDVTSSRLTSTSLIKMGLWPKWLVALVSGALIPFSFAPYFWWPMVFLGVMGYALSHRDITPKQSLFMGWLYGLGFYGHGVSWVFVSIHVYGGASLLLALVMTAAFAAGLALLVMLQSYCYVRWFAHRKPWGMLLGLPALWVLFEWLRSWLLTGFPWLYLGDASLENWLAAWVPIVGVFGTSLIIALHSVFLVEMIQRLLNKISLPENSKIKDTTHQITSNHAVTFVAVTSLLIAIVWGIGAGFHGYTWTQAQGEPLKVSGLQGNIPQEKKWLPEMQRPTLALYQQMTHENWDVDVIVWPETAIPVLYEQVTPVLEYLDSVGKDKGTALITGVPDRELNEDATQWNFFNGIIAVGAGEGMYYKQKLVPFGEYVPLEQYIRGMIQFFDLPMSSFLPGPKDQAPLKITKGDEVYHIAPFICYEIVYPQLVAEASKHAEVFLTISNDAWFGTSAGPHQHFGIVRMRALENGRYIIRVTNTGITAVVNPFGEVTAQLPQFVEARLDANVTRMTGQTPAARTGVIPYLFLCVVLLGLARGLRATKPPVV